MLVVHFIGDQMSETGNDYALSHDPRVQHVWNVCNFRDTMTVLQSIQDMYSLSSLSARQCNP